MSDNKITGKAFDFTLLKRIFSLVSKYKYVVVFNIILTVLGAALMVAMQFAVQYLYDNFVVKEFNKTGTINLQVVEHGILIAGAGYLSLLVLQTLFSYFQTYYNGWLGQQAIYQLRNRVFAHILGFRLRLYDKTPVGTLITRSINDVESIADIFGEGSISIIGDSMQILFILAAMFYTSWQLSLYSLSVFPLLLIAAYIFKEKVRISFQDVRTQVARLNAFIQEHITGMQIVQVFNRQKVEMDRFLKINAAHRDANIRGIMYYAVFFPVIELLNAIAVALIIWGGAREVMHMHATTGTLVLFILLINILFRPIRMIADKFNTLQMGMVAAGRIFAVLDTEDATADTGTIDKTIDGEVEFKHVWFAYNDEDWILKDISFEAKPGEMLAIVGHTGAGKTSITSLVNRVYDKQKGDICIDGIPVEDYRLDSLRGQVAVVLQDVFLFSDTIANNIRLFNPAITTEQMEEAARLVGADRFINKLPGGFEYQVQERGATLSTGQRQLISFIRAVLQKPRILILDEATSSIDHETEEMIQHATEVLLKDRTSIVIAHRLATIQKADKILVMEKGRIVESGTHEELISREGLYRNLYELQFTELVI
jgi:ATP-binding cassette, subfamily B, multidrug efflux pump